jgi:hypothetical protein
VAGRQVALSQVPVSVFIFLSSQPLLNCLTLPGAIAFHIRVNPCSVAAQVLYFLHTISLQAQPENPVTAHIPSYLHESKAEPQNSLFPMMYTLISGSFLTPEPDRQ